MSYKLVMRWTTLIAGILIGARFLPMPAQGQIIGYEPFDYKGPILDATGGVFWDNVNTATARGHTLKASDWDNEPGLPGVSACADGILYTADSGIIREYAGINTTGEGAGAVNEVNFDKKVYYRITMTRGTGTTWCMLSSFDFGTERLQFGLYPGRGVFGIYNLAGFPPIAESTVPVNVGQTYTMVAKVDFAANVVSLYVNPNLNGTEASNTPVATGTYTGSHWSTAVRVASAGSGLTAWDDLTVATTWESLRTYEVTTSSESGPGSLLAAAAAAGATGGRVTFPQAGAYYLLRGGNRLLRLRRDNPSVVAQDLAITGLQPSEKIVAMDFRNGSFLTALYALGITEVAGVGNDIGRLYILNPVTGAASLVGSGPFSTSLPGRAKYAFDFRTITPPETESNSGIRILHENGLHLLLNPATGSITFNDFLSGRDVLAMAHDISDLSSRGTLFAFIDSDPQLWRIGGPNGNPSANGGVMTPLRDVTPPTLARSDDGFDISDDGVGVFSVAGAGGLEIYNLNLETGAANRIGTLPSDPDYRGLSVAPSKITLDVDFPGLVTGPRDTIIDGGSHGGRVRIGFTDRLGSNSGIVVGNGEALAIRKVTYEGKQDVLVLVDGVLAASGSTFTKCEDRGAIEGIGSIKLERCTFVGNTYRGSFQGGAVTVFSNADITHCTFFGNRSLGSGITSGGGAILNRGSLNLKGCVLAGNSSATGIGPELRNQGTIVASGCVIGNGTDSGIVNGTNNNIVGTTASPQPANLAFLADYGGATHTMPPLPQSVAVNRVTQTSFSGDQRGFLINSAADSGAAEYQGRADIARFWDSDWDGDGSVYGMEQAVGTNPLISDPSSPRNLRIEMVGGEPVLTCGFVFAARPHTRWVIKRSTNLQSFSEQIFYFDGPTITSIGIVGYELTLSGDTLRLRDLAPNPPKMFYRLEVELSP
ncbi:MAG: DUF4394 domain-containing protein [Verrucomicrobia bacterium]|nr:MAG: DUF4394 domain-containing protein [Verrucomicrobiota bacterium]